MSKYRVKLKPSRLKVILSLTIFLMITLSVFTWQVNILKFQLLLQVLLTSVISFFGYKSIKQGYLKKLPIIVFSLDGEWVETRSSDQVNWKVTAESRVTSLILFVNIISPVNSNLSQWRILYRDQMNEQEFRRLCRTIIYQQQNVNQSI